MTKPPRARTVPPPPPGAERRKHERFEALAQVEMSTSGEVFVVPIVNISAGGVLLALDQVPRLRAGDAVSVFMDLGSAPDGAEMSVTLEAEVVRVSLAAPGTRSPASLALMWTSSEPEVAARLVEVLIHLRKQKAG